MREWLMSLIAGNRAYWIADSARDGIASLHTLLGAGAAIALVDDIKRAGATRATFELDGWTVTIEKQEG